MESPQFISFYPTTPDLVFTLLVGSGQVGCPWCPTAVHESQIGREWSIYLSSTSSGSIISAFRNALRFNSDTWVCYHLSSEIDLVPACLKLKY